MNSLELPKILLVDDMKVTLLLLDDILSSLNVDRIHAYSGEEALDLVRKHEFALIISDVQMPNMTGYEMLYEIRKIQGRENVSVIFLSATYKEESDIIKGIQSGAIDFLTKPFNRNILLAKVEIFLKLYEQNKCLNNLVDKLNEKNKELIRNRLFVEKITDAAIDAIIMTDNTGKIVFWNRAAENMFGYTAEEIMLSDIHNFISVQENGMPKEISYFVSKDSTDNNFNGLTIECQICKKSNQFAPVELTIAPLIIDNQRHTVSIARDISERKEAEEKLKLANKVKSEFIANMSHEFRTPMNVVIGISKALLNYDSENLNTEQIEGLRHIFQSGTRLLDLVNDLLDLAKIESGKMTVLLKSFSIGKLLSDLKGLAEELTKEKNLVFSVMKDEMVPEFLVSDQRKLYQVLVNLISNAVKFTEKGNIRLYVYISGSELHFEVSDTGIGISKENLDKVFEQFAQIDGSAQKKYKGTGLGLALCKEFVMLLKGKINIESRPGRGSIVKFFIPFQPSDNTKTEDIDQSTLSSELISPNNKLIILIEDDKELQYYYKNYLTKYNIVVECAEDGSIGIEKIKLLHPDLIILDLKLKSISGYDILRILKFEPDMRSIPVIVLSDLDDPPNDAFYNYDLFLNKPIDESQLLQHIRKVLSIKKNNDVKALIISENIKELRSIKKAFNDCNIIASTLPTTKKMQLVIEKLRPEIIVIDLDNLSFDFLQYIKTNADIYKTDSPVIVLYTKETASPELLSTVQNMNRIEIIQKSSSLNNSLVEILNTYRFAKEAGPAKISQLL
jgi:PAS domain S-box-containing protein